MDTIEEEDKPCRRRYIARSEAVDLSGSEAPSPSPSHFMFHGSVHGEPPSSPRSPGLSPGLLNRAQTFDFTPSLTNGLTSRYSSSAQPPAVTPEVSTSSTLSRAHTIDTPPGGGAITSYGRSRHRELEPSRHLRLVKQDSEGKQSGSEMFHRGADLSHRGSNASVHSESAAYVPRDIIGRSGSLSQPGDILKMPSTPTGGHFSRFNESRHSFSRERRQPSPSPVHLDGNVGGTSSESTATSRRGSGNIRPSTSESKSLQSSMPEIRGAHGRHSGSLSLEHQESAQASQPQKPSAVQRLIQEREQEQLLLAHPPRRAKPFLGRAVTVDISSLERHKPGDTLQVPGPEPPWRGTPSIGSEPKRNSLPGKSNIPPTSVSSPRVAGTARSSLTEGSRDERVEKYKEERRRELASLHSMDPKSSSLDIPTPTSSRKNSREALFKSKEEKPTGSPSHMTSISSRPSLSPSPSYVSRSPLSKLSPASFGTPSVSPVPSQPGRTKPPRLPSPQRVLGGTSEVCSSPPHMGNSPTSRSRFSFSGAAMQTPPRSPSLLKTPPRSPGGVHFKTPPRSPGALFP